jgi:uncharacterized membrane protein
MLIFKVQKFHQDDTAVKDKLAAIRTSLSKPVWYSHIIPTPPMMLTCIHIVEWNNAAADILAVLNDVKFIQSHRYRVKYIMYDKSAQVMKNVTQLINSLKSIFRSTKKVKQKKKHEKKIQNKWVCMEQASKQ